MMPILLWFQLYFFINEIRQLIVTRAEYFKSVKNWLDIMQLFLTSFTVIAHYQYPTIEEFSEFPALPPIHAMASLILWINFMYFLRLFDQTSYLIRIIINVFWDMKTFLLILLISQLGFGEAFLRLSEYSLNEGNYLNNLSDAYIFTYKVSIGENNTESFDYSVSQVVIWILLIVCSICT